jgi:hypothetical protein
MSTKEEIQEATEKVYEAIRNLESLVEEMPEDMWANPKDEGEAEEYFCEAHDIALALFPLYTGNDNFEVDVYCNDLLDQGGMEEVDYTEGR